MLDANPFGLFCLFDSYLEAEIIIQTTIIPTWAPSERKKYIYLVLAIYVISGFYTDGLLS